MALPKYVKPTTAFLYLASENVRWESASGCRILKNVNKVVCFVAGVDLNLHVLPWNKYWNK
jgi:hypothetical protein